MSHPAVRLYREVCRLWPNQVQRPQIARVVGDDAKALELYREVLNQFMLEGQNKSRVDWTLERFSAAQPAPIAQPTNDAFSPSSICQHIQNRRRELREFAGMRLEQDPLTDALAEVIGCLTEIESQLKEAGTVDTRVIDEELTKAENLLDTALLAVTPAALLESINIEVAERLKPYRGRMEATAYATAFHRSVLKRLHEQFALPRLGLFNL